MVRPCHSIRLSSISTTLPCCTAWKSAKRLSLSICSFKPGAQKITLGLAISKDWKS